MATISIHKTDGTQAGSLELNDGVFAIEPSVQCVRAAVNQFLANQRAGTHSTKTRAFVSGGGRKPWKQKGTGRARQGSIRSAQWRHGAIIFGPQPRDHAYSVNAKVRQKALRSIWSELVQSGRLIVVESFGLDKPKTSALVTVLDALGVDGTALLVTARTEESTALSARNLAWVTALNVDNLNVYDLLTHDWVVATQEAIQRVEAIYA